MDTWLPGKRPASTDCSRRSATFVGNLTTDQGVIFRHVCRLYNVDVENALKRPLADSDVVVTLKEPRHKDQEHWSSTSEENDMRGPISEHTATSVSGCDIGVVNNRKDNSAIALWDDSFDKILENKSKAWSGHSSSAQVQSTPTAPPQSSAIPHDQKLRPHFVRPNLHGYLQSAPISQNNVRDVGLRGHHYLIVSGPAGTGKSHLVKELFTRVLDNHALQPKLLTPTNCAATFIDGVTIDKFLSQFLSTSSVMLYERLEMMIIEKKISLQRMSHWSLFVRWVRHMIQEDQHLSQIPSCASNFVAVDEMSMVSLLKMAMVVAVMPPDCIFLLLGDACQLPPVVNFERIQYSCRSKQISLETSTPVVTSPDAGCRVDGVHQQRTGYCVNSLITGNVFSIESEPLFTGVNNVRFHMTQNVRFCGDPQGFLSVHGATIRHCLLNDMSLATFNSVNVDNLFYQLVCAHATTHSSAEFDLLPQPKVVLGATIRNVLKHEQALLNTFVARKSQKINIVYAMLSFEFKNGTGREFRPKDLLDCQQIRHAFRKHLRQDSALRLSIGIPVVFTMTASPDNGLPEGIYNGLVGTFVGISYKEIHPSTGDALMVQCDQQLFAVPLVVANLSRNKEMYKFQLLVDTVLSKWPRRPADDGIFKAQIVGFSVTHFPLLPLLASTVHGVQGSTLNMPVLVDGRQMTKKHYYVATTRSTQANNLYFDKLFTNGTGGRQVKVSNSKSVEQVWRQAGSNRISRIGYTTTDRDIKRALERCRADVIVKDPNKGSGDADATKWSDTATSPSS